MSVRSEAFFLPTARGERYGLHLCPPGAGEWGVLMLPPFAEEANKSRRHLAQTGRALAALGAQVLLADLGGTGDSAGEFAEANWAGWLADVDDFAQWLRAAGCAKLCLWGLRAGALLACDALKQGTRAEALLFNAPALSGKQVMTQFLRLGAAGELGSSNAVKIDTRALRSALGAGLAVEIAGYTLSPALAAGLEHAELQIPAEFGGPLGWVDISSADPPQSSPAAQQFLEAWRANGHPVRATCLRGPAFWQTQEIEPVKGLEEANARLMAALMAEGA